MIPEYRRCVAALRGMARGALPPRSPRLNPWDSAGFQLGDDLVGDFRVKARTVVACARAAVMSGHRGSPRRAPEASLPTLNPSRQTRSALSLFIAQDSHVTQEIAAAFAATIVTRMGGDAVMAAPVAEPCSATRAWPPKGRSR